MPCENRPRKLQMWVETVWAVFDTHEESYEIGGRGAVTDLHLIEKLRFRTSRALDAQLSISIKNSIKKSIYFGPPELWRLLGALEAPQFNFVKHCNKKSIYFGRPELWELQSSFLLRILLRKASI